MRRLPILESGTLDATKIKSPYVVNIKGEEYIVAILEGMPVIIKSSIDMRRLFAISNMPAKPSMPLIFVPQDFCFQYADMEV